MYYTLFYDLGNKVRSGRKRIGHASYFSKISPERQYAKSGKKNGSEPILPLEGFHKRNAKKECKNRKINEMNFPHIRR